MALTMSWQEDEERSAPCRKVVTCGGGGGGEAQAGVGRGWQEGLEGREGLG